MVASEEERMARINALIATQEVMRARLVEAEAKLEALSVSHHQ